MHSSITGKVQRTDVHVDDYAHGVVTFYFFVCVENGQKMASCGFSKCPVLQQQDWMLSIYRCSTIVWEIAKRSTIFTVTTSRQAVLSTVVVTAKLI